MTDTISLNGWPATRNCITWSHDNIIALGLKDKVTLIIPSIQPKSKAEQKWNQVTIDAGTFSKDEWPARGPAPWSTFSVSEELSQREVVAVQWSSPGIGRFGRPVLAVLTANSALSIWECLGRLDVKHDWHRVLVLNDEINKAHTGQHASETRFGVDAQSERLAGRIVSFAWAPELREGSQSTYPDAYSATFLTVSDEGGRISVLRIIPPHSLSGSGPLAWSCSQVLSTQVSGTEELPRSALQCALGSLFRGHHARPTQLTWSPWWIESEDCATSVLAYCINDRLAMKVIKLRHGIDTPHMSFVDVNTSAVSGIVRSHAIWDATSLYLVVDDALVRMQVDYSGPPIASTLALQSSLDRWLPTSGVAIAASDKAGSKRVIVSRLAETVEKSIVCFDVRTKAGKEGDGEGAAHFAVTSLQESLTIAIHNTQKSLNLPEESLFARVHNAATSRSGQTVVASATLHPLEGLEYTIEAKQETMVAMSSPMSKVTSAAEMQPRSYAPSADLFCFETMNRLRASSEDNQEAFLIDAALEEETSRYLEWTCPQQVPALKDGHALDLHDVSRRLRYKIASDSAVRESRKRLLIDRIRGRRELNIQSMCAINETIAASVCGLPEESYAGFRLSQALHDIQSRILTTLAARRDAQASTHAQPEAHAAPETCEICNSGIPFEALAWSRCEQGHQYRRCRLTYLTIQLSWSTKSCGICQTQYINEYTLPALHNMQSDGEPESMNETLLRIVFSAFDICIYCTGRYTGS